MGGLKSVTKDFIRFPLRINIEQNKEIDSAVHYLNMELPKRVSKQQFIMDAINEKIEKQKESTPHVTNR